MVKTVFGAFFMATLKINGGIPLFGDITVSGSKNAALPIIFSSIIMRGVSKISNVPDISDVRVALEIIEGYGARVLRQGDTLYIDTRELVYREPDPCLVSKIRASTYLIGASVARFGRCKISRFGGCDFAARPIDLHISAAESFGAEKLGDMLLCKKLMPTELTFSKKSVGATANAMILAAASEGKSIIRGHAKEPHISALAEFLTSAGAKIILGDEEIVIFGGTLHGANTRIIGDMIEAGTYLAAGLVTNGRVGVLGANISDMAAFLSFLERTGANVEINDGYIAAERGDTSNFAEIAAEPYPAYPTDLQPIAAPIMAVLSGGKIFDRVFAERFGYLNQLAAFGIKYKTAHGMAKIESSTLRGGEAILPDLRGGAACMLAALACFGESRLYNAEMLLRGYDSLNEKMLALGADMEFES